MSWAGAFAAGALALGGCASDAASASDPGAPPAVRALRVEGCDSGLRVEFAGDLDPKTLTDGTFYVERASGQPGYDPAGRAATFRPDRPFSSGESYTAVLTTGVTSAVGVPLAETLRWQFVCVDRTPPVVVGRQPLGDGISPLAQVSVRFSEPIDTASLTADNFRVAGRESTIAYDPATFTVTLQPKAALYPGRTYEVSVSARVRDLAGNALGTDVEWTFRTRAPVDDWAAALVTPPLPQAAPCDTPIELRLADDFTPDPDSLGSPPVSIDGVPDVDVAWDEARRILRVTPRVPLRPGGHYPVVASGLLRDVGHDTPFDPGTAIAQLTVVSSCDEPTVAWVPDAAGTVDCAGPLDLRFSVPMDPASASAVVLSDLTAGGYDPAHAPPVAASVSFDPGAQLASLKPAAPLLDGRRYRLAVTADAHAADGRPLRTAGGWEIAARCR